jgi:RNA polymerase sigma-70 factor, ECF subfamily
VTITEATSSASDVAGLLARARQGDGEAFCRLVEAHECKLYQQALALCANPQAAEDLVAETMVEAWRSLGRFDGSCRLTTWLYAIMVHRHLKLLRRNRSRPVAAASFSQVEAEKQAARLTQLPDSQPSAFDKLAQAEHASRLRGAIAALPAAHQSVVLLRFYEEASLAEIGAALGLPVGTVKSRLHHALLRLRQMQTVLNLHAPGGDQ